jgi:hypothetical protein
VNSAAAHPLCPSITAYRPYVFGASTAAAPPAPLLLLFGHGCVGRQTLKSSPFLTALETL